MATTSHLRVVSIVLAISVVVGAGLLLELSSRPVISEMQPVSESLSSTPSPPQQLPSPSVPKASVPAAQPEISSNGRLMHKCERNGRISYTDKPCAASERTPAVPAEALGLPPVQQEPDLARMRRQLARMEAERHQREQQFEQEAAARRQPVAVPLAKTLRCPQIDKDIGYIDSLLRQPHNAQAGDELTERRKRLTDERFDLGC